MRSGIGGWIMGCSPRTEQTRPSENEAETFGDFLQYDRAKIELDNISVILVDFPDEQENERNFILAAVRRTHSLTLAFRQAIDSKNGQMALTILRLNLDTLARFYALYWADETEGMTAEFLARSVMQGRSIRDFKFRGSGRKATDQWLIQQIAGLGDWIAEAYRITSGSIHFSEFHIKQVLSQAENITRLEDGSVQLQSVLIDGPDRASGSDHYQEVKQAFLHVTLMLICAMKDRCGLLER